MNEQRPTESRPSPDESTENRQVERDSQLSAMFDGELSAAECELLARRLTRDDTLRAQWSRYAVIGAALRAERGVALNDRVSRRVQSVVAQEASYGEAGMADAVSSTSRSGASGASGAGGMSASRWMKWGRPAAGAGIAASVAAVSILFLRGQEISPESSLANVTAPEAIVSESIAAPPDTGGAGQVVVAAADRQPASNGEPERYSTPAPSSQTGIAPPARFANYVVAHSEYSGPLARRMALLGIVGTDAQADGQADGEVPAEGAAPGAARAPAAGAVDAP